MDAHGQQLLDRIMRKGSLPSLSPLAVRLMSLAADENSQAQDLARVIEADPALAARLLSLVNSSLYRVGEEEVTGITRAIMLLGFREVRIMALSLSLRDTMPLKSKDELDYALYWRMNVQRAIMAQMAAQTLRLPNPEEAFAAGLMLQIGLPLLLRALEPSLRAGYPGFAAPRIERLNWERETAGVTHREVGAAVVSCWKLPGFFADCMLERPGGGQTALAVGFADVAVEACFLPERSFTQIYAAGHNLLQLDAERVNKIVAETLAIGSQVAAALEVELNQEQDLLLVMEKANAALSHLSSQVTPKLRQVVQKAAQLDSAQLQQQAVVNTLQAVMHEIRNPLMSVGGFAKRLAGLGEAGGHARHYAQVIMDEASRLDGVLNQVCALLAPLKEIAVKVDAAAFLAKHLPHSMLSNWQPPDEPVQVTVDPVLLAEALALLLDYVKHKLAPQGPSLSASLARRNGRVWVCLHGFGALPLDAAMGELSFGPELNLVRVRRIMEALHGGLDVAIQENNFTLALYVPDMS